MASGGLGSEPKGTREEEDSEEEGSETFTVFEGKPEELGEFLSLHRPSDPTWNKHNTDWVSVSNPYRNWTSSNYDKAFDSWDKLLEKRQRITNEQIEEIAIDSKITSGKWLIFRHRRIIDEIWQKIAEATVAGKLGISSKVATVYTCKTSKRCDEQDIHLICVFTENFVDKDDVMRVEKELRHMGITDILKYKPDIYTHLDIYKDNKFRIKVAKYTTKC